MKNAKKIMSLLLVLVLSIGCLFTNVYADTYKAIISTDGTIIETDEMLLDGTIATFTRETKTSGATVVTIVQDGKYYVETGMLDYNELKDRVSEIRKVDTTGGMTRAQEHINNCYHVTIATNEITVTREEGAVSAAAMAAILGSAFTANPSILYKLALAAYRKFSKSDIAYVEVTEEVNEVYFKADGVYYTHCYHDNVICYDAYDHRVDSYSTKYQSVGG